MAAYGAATSLKNTIQRILQSSRISLVSHSPLILPPVYDQMDRLQRVLQLLDKTSCSKIRTEVNALDELIKEAVWEFEDLLESHLLPQILPQLESERHNLSFSVDLQSLQHHVDCFVEMVKMMEEEYIIGIKNMPEEEGEPISSRIDFGGIKSKMVGLSYEFQKAGDDLLEDKHYSIVGMAGVGKTTLAKHIFEDPSIQSHFDFRIWVKVGRKYEHNELLCCVLAQVAPIAYRMLAQGDNDDEELVGLLKEKLQDKKCLIVLDDVWEEQATYHLTNCLQENDMVGRIRYLLTSRQYIIFEDHGYERMRLLNEEESKKLLGEKVFGQKVFSEDGFPLPLEELGEKIAKKCEGLPLMIVTVAELLSKADKTPEYWTEVLKQHSSVFVEAYNQISEYLSLRCNGELPPSISNLFHLQFLVIDPHMFIRKRGVQSYMPVQIWDMQELEHLYIWGMDLPTPNTVDATLNKLTILGGVSANSCTREVLKRIPNLKELMIEVELKPYDDDDDERNPLSCLGYISQLQNLEKLRYRVKNPEIKYKGNTIPLSMFPSSLKVLWLSGLGGYPWNYLNDIGSLLPNLEILLLERYAFRGPEWEITPESFLKLIELQIGDTDLVRWRPQRGSFPNLRRLRMSHCYKLQQLDWPYDHSWIEIIDLLECNPLAVACAKELKDKFSFRLIIESSF
ncbi:putative late blight resistance protein homolog R1A-4 [Salvia miltiorrhiza]|uniref:putative late blight resistance protein homolog R1A-4 n=1 Tax=Salvia miltiorrhiza TaxID=226208 RepID=UPI0025ACCB02|nr:putative late blight resistance protein homolog R1A-4 [Salvia miltiorrhiza]